MNVQHLRWARARVLGGQRFICLALRQVSDESQPTIEAIRRLLDCGTCEDWLLKRGHITEYPVSVEAKAAMQQYRVRWLDALIKEHE